MNVFTSTQMCVWERERESRGYVLSAHIGDEDDLSLYLSASSIMRIAMKNIPVQLDINVQVIYGILKYLSFFLSIWM